LGNDENWRSGLAMRVDRLLIDGFLPSHPDAIWADADGVVCVIPPTITIVAT
jgi:hypothetical protein